MERLCGFKRARSSVEAYVKSHLSHLVPTPQRKPRTYRRFRRARIGELYQHDSSIHQWWPAPDKQYLLLTVDDHSGRNVAGTFVSAETTWNHFQHFRRAFETHGLPEVIYTDGLSLFGTSSSTDRGDPEKPVPACPARTRCGSHRRAHSPGQRQSRTPLRHLSEPSCHTSGSRQSQNLRARRRDPSNGNHPPKPNPTTKHRPDPAGRCGTAPCGKTTDGSVQRPFQACLIYTSPCAAPAGSITTKPSILRVETTRSPPPPGSRSPSYTTQT